MNENLEKENKNGHNMESSNANRPLKILTATSIIGDKVENKKGEIIGEIKDIMIDIHSWKTEYIIIESGGFIGIGQKLFAIPYNAFKVNSNDQRFILDIDKKMLEKAPGFDQDHWPETNSHYLDATAHWGDFMGPNVSSF